MTETYETFGLNCFMGNHGMGMLDSLSEHDLFVTNTSCQHAARHTTTLTGWRKDLSAGRNCKKTLPVFLRLTSFFAVVGRSLCLMTLELMRAL